MPIQKAEEIAGYFNEKTFHQNELLLKEGRFCSEYHFLCKGFMRSWTIDLEGRDVTTAFYSARNVVCELFSFFTRIPSPENIQAMIDSTTLFLTYDQLQDAFHAMPEFREFGRGILVRAYAGLKQRMLSGLHE